MPKRKRKRAEYRGTRTEDEIITQLRARTVRSLPQDWKKERLCPECGVDADRPKCMLDMGPSCPRHDPDNYEPSPYVTRPDVWTVQVSLEPKGREILWPIAAESCIEALDKAVKLLKLRDGERLHKLTVHIGAPERTDDLA